MWRAVRASCVYECGCAIAFASNGIGPLHRGSQKGRARAHNTRNSTSLHIHTGTNRHKRVPGVVIHRRARCERMRLLFCDVIIYFSHVRIFYSAFFAVVSIHLYTGNLMMTTHRLTFSLRSLVAASCHLHVEVYFQTSMHNYKRDRKYSTNWLRRAIGTAHSSAVKTTIFAFDFH